MMNNSLASERKTVQEILKQSMGQLYMPFDRIAQAQIEKAAPHDCAMVVLATCLGEDESAGASDRLREQRIYLGAALEMLQIALTIHRFLLRQETPHRGEQIAQEDQEDNVHQRSVTGSVILTGDYCFTQSAILAAKTDNVQVVEIFSQTLKRVSETILSQLFIAKERIQKHESNATQTLAPTANRSSRSEDETKLALCKAGLDGSAALVALSPSVLDSAKVLAEVWLGHQQEWPLSPAILARLDQLPTAIRQRWIELFRADVLARAPSDLS